MGSKEFGKGRLGFVKLYVKGKRILDIGCAGSNGFMHRIIIENNKSSEVVGLDIDFNNLKKLKKFSNELILADAEHLPFKDAVFDCVYMGELIEHFWSAKELLSEANRVLKDGGVICLDTPNVYSINRIIRFVLKGKDSLGDPDHKIFYTPASLSKLLNTAGFEVIEVTSDKKIKIGFLSIGKEVILNFPPFKWLGSHLCLVAEKRKQKS